MAEATGPDKRRIARSYRTLFGKWRSGLLFGAYFRKTFVNKIKAGAFARPLF